jgi:hypothetical protein
VGRRPAAIVVIVVIVASGICLSVLVAGARSAKVRIMPLGDSITATGCTRGYLWRKLIESGRARLDFVGSRNTVRDCALTSFDRDHEGHGGYLVSDLVKRTSTGRPPGADPADLYVASAADLATWFDGRPADIVLMHFGSNDLWSDRPPSAILAAYSAILQRLRAANPRVRLLVAQIIPLDPQGCRQCPERVRRLNALVPGWAAAHDTAASRVQVVDQWTGFDVAADTKDRVHPNQRGAAKMAARWFEAVVAPDMTRVR